MGEMTVVGVSHEGMEWVWKERRVEGMEWGRGEEWVWKERRVDGIEWERGYGMEVEEVQKEKALLLPSTGRDLKGLNQKIKRMRRS